YRERGILGPSRPLRVTRSLHSARAFGQSRFSLPNSTSNVPSNKGNKGVASPTCPGVPFAHGLICPNGLKGASRNSTYCKNTSRCYLHDGRRFCGVEAC